MVFTWLLYKTLKFRQQDIFYNKLALHVDLADSVFKKSLGLMYRERPGNDGMLFISDHDERYGIWMLNMKFAIDILWLDKSGTVISIKESARPCTSIFNCEVYRPDKKARYVLELASGACKRYGIRKGSKFLLHQIS